MSDRFVAGDLCLLIDTKGRRYLFDLEPGRTFQYHAGTLGHDSIVGSAPGTTMRSSTGSRLVALRPRLADYILNMKRGAQVIYPKDLAAMVHWGDVSSGHRVIEAGTGSGALTMALLRAVGPGGRVVSVERRGDHLEHARKTIGRFMGGLPENLELIEGEVAEVLESRSSDRVMLDVPEPWHLASSVASSLEPGGVLTVYLPTVPQLQRLHEALQRTRSFIAVETFENLIRDWRISGRSVRPANMMVGHTGFLTTAHRVEPDATDPAEAGPGD